MADCAARRCRAIASRMHDSAGGNMRAGKRNHAAGGEIILREFARGRGQQPMEGSLRIRVSLELV